MIPKFSFSGLTVETQEAFKLLTTFFKSLDIVKSDWKFFEFSVPGAVVNYAIPHNLKFTPRDILTTKVTGTITFHYDLFDDSVIYITTVGAVSFRGFIGQYRGDA